MYTNAEYLKKKLLTNKHDDLFRPIDNHHWDVYIDL